MKTKKTFSVLTACFKRFTVLLALSVTLASCSGGGKTVPGKSLADKLTWLQTNAESDGNYILEVRANESFAPYELSYGGRNNVTITLKGVGANRAVSLASDGSMFTIGSGFTLVLETITLYGRNNNNAPLVNVDKNGTLVMNNGSAVSGNSSSWGVGGVRVNENGTFTMNGGTISGNEGGGVRVYGGTFTMSGGTISGNEGGGVRVDYNGTFTMSGGTISGNTARGDGGGVDVGGTFTMNGGEISGNTASRGGGVSVGLGGTFTMSGGAITGNTGGSGGGGVRVSDGNFIPNGGTVSGNTPDDVYVSGAFIPAPFR